MNDLWTKQKAGPPPQGLHFGYEKAGLVIYDEAIPWNADQVIVEALVRMTGDSTRWREQCKLTLDGQNPVAPVAVRPEPARQSYRLVYHLRVPDREATANLTYRNQVLGQVLLPVVSLEEFVGSLELTMATVFVHLNGCSVACSNFAPAQCRGLTLSGILTGPTSLAPLADLPIQVELASDQGQQISRAVRMSSSQFATRSTLLAVNIDRLPRQPAGWVANWMVGSQVLGSQPFRTVELEKVRGSLRLSRCGYVFQRAGRPLETSPHLPAEQDVERLGPLFMIASGEQGVAAFCRMRTSIRFPGRSNCRILSQEDVLITDGPSLFAPGTVEMADLQGAHTFELRCGNRLLGRIPATRAPEARFDAEGAFKPPHDFSWSRVADHELASRLEQLR